MNAAELPVTGDAWADQLLVEDPFALVVGMLLDQQVPLEWAFRGPATLAARLGPAWSARGVAEMDPDRLEAACRERPAIHRYPAAMAKRIGALARYLCEHYDGDAAQVWSEPRDGEELLARVVALPGFGEEKARIFVALLAKRFGVRPLGWERAAAPFSDDQPRSVADIDSRAGFDAVKAWKADMRAKGRAKTDPA